MFTRSRRSSRRRSSSALPDFALIHNREIFPVGADLCVCPVSKPGAHTGAPLRGMNNSAGFERNNIVDLHLLYIGRRGGSGFGAGAAKTKAVLTEKFRCPRAMDIKRLGPFLGK